MIENISSQKEDWMDWASGFACGFSESFMEEFAERFAEGIGRCMEKNIVGDRAKLIRVLMRKMDLSAEAAMAYAEIPEQDRDILLRRIFDFQQPEETQEIGNTKARF